MHIDPAEFQVALKWWLGIDTSPHLRCPHCPDHQLDPLGHHALTCRGGGDAVLRHNSLRDVVAQFCHRARLGGQLEVGGGIEADGSRSRPADYLVPNSSTGKPAAFDITVTSLLNPISLPEAKVTGGSVARMAEMRKHISNDPKCRGSAFHWPSRPMGAGEQKPGTPSLVWHLGWPYSCIAASQKPCINLNVLSEDDNSVRLIKDFEELERWLITSSLDALTMKVSASRDEVMSHLFTDELVAYIVKQTNLYASQRNGPTKFQSWTPIDVQELKAYLGFNIRMGLVTMPEIKDYWKKDPLYHYEPIASRICRDRFKEISRYLHFVENTNLAKRGEIGFDR
ncbi:hypothetical protein EMCRGX_G033151 [Ephydatia muelleri]